MDCYRHECDKKIGDNTFALYTLKRNFRRIFSNCHWTRLLKPMLKTTVFRYVVWVWHHKLNSISTSSLLLYHIYMYYVITKTNPPPTSYSSCDEISRRYQVDSTPRSSNQAHTKLYVCQWERVMANDRGLYPSFDACKIFFYYSYEIDKKKSDSRLSPNLLIFDFMSTTTAL